MVWDTDLPKIKADERKLVVQKAKSKPEFFSNIDRHSSKMQLDNKFLFEGATNDQKKAFAEYFQRFDAVVNKIEDLSAEDKEEIFNLLKLQGYAKLPDFKSIAE